MPSLKIKNHYTEEEFKSLFVIHKNDAIVYNRLVFIRSLMNGNSIKDTAKILDISTRTGSEWLRRYNESGVEGLKPHYNERGRKCKLSDEQLKQLEEKISEKDSVFTVKDVQKYISDTFEINYSYKQAWEISRRKLDFNYGKPFLKYGERPKDYKEELKKTKKIH